MVIIVQSLILWKQINGLGRQLLMNAIIRAARDFTTIVTVVVLVGKITLISLLIQTMVLEADSRSIPLSLSM
jgi:hypothetical protein